MSGPLRFHEETKVLMCAKPLAIKYDDFGPGRKFMQPVHELVLSGKSRR
jgi:hypothetical protein